MREIKFRAWNIEEERMIQNIQQEYDGREEDCFAQFIEQEGNHCRVGKKGKYHVMQYTGLKDKNGVEIYEGDIVERRRERGLVDFNDNNYGAVLGWNLLLYQLIPYQKEGWIYADKGKDGELEPIEFYYGCPPDESWEVVGNIFEGVDK